MIKWLIRKFVEEKDGGDKSRRRLLCGRLSGTAGIFIYAFIGIVKVFVGLIIILIMLPTLVSAFRMVMNEAIRYISEVVKGMAPS